MFHDIAHSKGPAMLKLAVMLTLLPLTGVAQQAMTVTTADGVTVYGELYPQAGERLRGTILLFHQAGSNATEYATIGPELAAMGFDALAIDQRSGGPRTGAPNRTVDVLGGSTGYLEALPDLEAALNWARTRGDLPVILWGSSYSSSLVLVLAGRDAAGVDAVLAFSPGEYLRGVGVADSVTTLTVPAYVTSSGSAEEVAAAGAIVAAMPAGIAELVTPDVGVHGSSTLIPSMNPGGWEANWVPVRAFLDRVAP
jgi:alpha-beta hydrolase superfamily lysophospholipase